MNAVAKIKPDVELADAALDDPLALLRAPFPAHQISKLPKPTKQQTDEVKADFKKGIRCQVCNSWHHPAVVHLDYVGHAALTDRLLDADPHWSWEPMGLAPDGTPAFDRNGGLWIKLTVCGVTRLGYGNADGKAGGDAVKEIIGDALRNAAMRFGAALDLWHKGDLHVADDGEQPNAEELAVNALQLAKTADAFKEVWAKNKDGWKGILEPEAYARVVAVMKTCAAKFTAPPKQAEPPPAEDFGIGEDEIPF